MDKYTSCLKILEKLLEENEVILLTGEHNIGKTKLFNRQKLETEVHKKLFGYYIDYLYYEEDDLKNNSLSRRKRLLEDICNQKDKNVIVDNLGECLHWKESEELVKDLLYTSKENGLKICGITNNCHIINCFNLGSIIYLKGKNLSSLEDNNNKYIFKEIKGKDNYNILTEKQ